MSSVVIEAEFVEVGKHQKVVTSVASLETNKAKELFTTWCYTNAYPNFSDNKMKGKSIRNQLRSFGWYVVKSKGGYSLMEEIDISEAGRSGLQCMIAFSSITEEIDEPYEDRIIRDCGFHIVWVPSLQKRLIMRRCLRDYNE